MLFYKKLFCLLLLLANTAYAQQSQIVLTNGDSLSVEIIKQTAEFITVSHPSLGTLTIAKEQVVLIKPIETKVATAEPAEPKVEQTTDAGLFGSGLLSGWEKRFDLGVAGREGKSRNLQINAGFSADYESDLTRINHKTAYYRAGTDGKLSAHSFYTLLNRDWLRPDTPWLYFAAGKLDLDEFKDWDYRLSVSGGFGYDFYDTDSFLLVGRGGLGFSQTFGGLREEFIPEGLLGIDGKWLLNAAQKITFANTLYPNLKDNGEFRNISTFDWIMELNDTTGIALKLGLYNEYDSAEQQGRSNDFKYTASLSWIL